MTEDEAQQWIADHFGVEAMDRLRMFVARVVEENGAQNLISPATVPHIWARHVVDSAQLLRLAPPGWKMWLDIGTGGGFPGMIVALLAPERMVRMVEPRVRRAVFLADCVKAHALAHAQVEQHKVQGAVGAVDVISARAVASVDDLLRDAAHCATGTTTWLLPRGRTGRSEARAARMFHVEHSVTDAESYILVVRGVPK